MAIKRLGPPTLRLIPGGDSPRFTSRVGSLLSEIEHGGTSITQMRELSASIRSKIAYLESKLAHDAKTLRQDVQSFLVAMASSRKDELSGSGINFKDPTDPAKIAVRLESGETDSSEAQPKIDLIIAGCIEVANTDLAFLRTVSLKQGRTISADQLSKLRDILENNTYWRFIEPT